MTKQLLLLISFLALSFSGYAQQDPMFTKYMFNSLVYNPAYAGSKEYMSLGVLYRQQWVGLEGAPITQSVTAHTPLNERIGIGLSLVNDAIGATGSTVANLSYAYRFKFGAGKLSLGLQAGMMNWRANWDKLSYRGSRSEDQAFADISPNQWLFNVGGGVYYYSKRFYVGFSVPRVINQELKRENNSMNNAPVNRVASLYRHYYFSIGGALLLNGEALILKPSLLVKSVGLFGGFIDSGTSLKRVGAPIEFDIDMSLLFHQKFWIGLSFRSAIEAFVGDKSSYDSVDIWASFILNNGLRIGAAYDYPLSKINLVSQASFEVMVGYEFNYFGKKIVTPRYF